MIKKWIEHTKSLDIDREELFNFTRLWKEKTGFPCDVWIDVSNSYKDYMHDLCVYADYNNMLIPITVSDKPSVKMVVPFNALDLSGVIMFVSKYHDLLERVANEEYDYFDFLSIVDYACENKTLTESKELNTLNSTLPEKETGLSTKIWVDENATYQGHAPRIKFRTKRENKNTFRDPSMEILNPERIHNLPERHDLSKKEIEDIQKFVLKYQKELLALSKKEMTIIDFKSLLQKPENVVTVINNIYGIEFCRVGKKYNFKKNGHFLLNVDVDEAQPFADYGGELVAWIRINDEWFSIDENGNKVDL